MSNRDCRKCGKQIPYYIVIDNKRRNLKNRKFCLDCSPFGSKNRFSDDPSRKPKRDKQYNKWTEEQKQTHRLNIKTRGHNRKTLLVERHGSQCFICGYKTCKEALEFHHKNPQEKLFELSGNNIRSIAWNKVLEEADKCVLLCCRCHRELHSEHLCLIKNT